MVLKIGKKEEEGGNQINRWQAGISFSFFPSLFFFYFFFSK